MRDIPRVALILGAVGALPFLWGALTMLSEPAAAFTAHWLGARFLGPYLQLAYGTVILAFMSGVLWGFSTRAPGQAAGLGYVLSVIPALWAFLFVGGGVVSSTIYLGTGFAGLLLIDWVFWQHGLAPGWWLRFRAAMTAVVLATLAPVFLV